MESGNSDSHVEHKSNGPLCNSSSFHREKLIIDTDPGIDDSMTILMAFQTLEVEVIGLTTVFGNVSTEDSSRNALLLCEIAGYPNVPVAEGSHEPLKGGKPRIADWVHGSDGLGNLYLPSPKRKKIEKNAAEFLVDKVSEYPGEVSILALGPLTNLALAIKRDSSFASKVKRVVVLGGAFFAMGNVNPAAEANIYGDPEAADVVFTSAANITVVGINITTQVKFTDEDLHELWQSQGRHTQLITDMCKFYRDWHVKSDGVCGIFLHDPVSFVALVRPDLFTYKKGVVRVETQGICMGHTLMDQGLKNWNSSNPWTGYSPVSVAWTVNVEEDFTDFRQICLFNSQSFYEYDCWNLQMTPGFLELVLVPIWSCTQKLSPVSCTDHTGWCAPLPHSRTPVSSPVIVCDFPVFLTPLCRISMITVQIGLGSAKVKLSRVGQQHKAIVHYSLWQVFELYFGCSGGGLMLLGTEQLFQSNRTPRQG
ncbi:Uridine nucleosidase 1 [Ancistrocladus abbreviatus]